MNEDLVNEEKNMKTGGKRKKKVIKKRLYRDIERDNGGTPIENYFYSRIS